MHRVELGRTGECFFLSRNFVILMTLRRILAGLFLTIMKLYLWLDRGDLGQGVFMATVGLKREQMAGDLYLSVSGA